jgi:DNA-binding HxlR family transcriptional regulator
MPMEWQDGWQEVLQCKWSVAVLAALGDGLCRPSQILRRYPSLTAKVLSERLRKLERLNLVERLSFDGYPRHTEYHLTADGAVLARWAKGLLASGLSVDELTTILRCRYIVAILRLLAERPRRPKELWARLRIADKVLFERLAKLESLGLVHREIVPTRPLQVRYHLTERGAALLPLLPVTARSPI